jgi:hypothetical protein
MQTPRDPESEPLFEILAPNRQSLPLVFNSPHSGRSYPPDFLAASRLSDPGVAMKIKVQGDASITGQVAEAGKLAQAPAQSTSVPTSIAGHRTKVENGKTYIWLTDSVGSVAGGHWAELNSSEAQAVVGVVGQKPTQTRTAPSQMRSY